MSFPALLPRFLALASAALLVGCTNLAALSSGHVGCVENDIVVTDDAHSGSVRTWTATCNGKAYACSAANDHPLDGTVGQVSCRPQLEDPPPTYAKPRARPPAPGETTGAGCKNDMECKGDRVCRKGACEDPQSGATPTVAASGSAAPTGSAAPPSSAAPTSSAKAPKVKAPAP